MRSKIGAKRGRGGSPNDVIEMNNIFPKPEHRDYQSAKMAPSMRQQSAREKHRLVRDNQRQYEREEAARLLRTGLKVAAVCRSIGIKRGTCDRICKALQKNDNVLLQKLLDPANNRAGRKSAIRAD